MIMTKTADSTNHKTTKKHKFKNLFRFIVSIVAIFCLIKFGKVDINTAVKYLQQVNPYYFVLAYLCYFVTTLTSGFRFYLSSRALGFEKSYPQLVQLNFVGIFFNNFLPTTFGGDALRGYYLKKGSHIPLSKAVACILYERYTGMIVLFWAASTVFSLQYFGVISQTAWQVPHQLVFFTHCGTLVTIFFVPFLPQINKLLFGKSNWIHKHVIEPVIVYWKDSRLTTKIVFLSMFLQMTVLLCHIFIAVSLNIDIPLSYFFVFYPLTTIAGFLIPSLNGLGIREGAYIYFLSQVNINNDLGLAFSIGWLIVLGITSIIGGLIYMFGDFRKHKPLQEIVEKTEAVTKS